MFGLPLAFAAPAVLAALVGLVGALFPPARHAAAPRRACFRRCGCCSGSIRTRRRPRARPGRSWLLRLAIGALIILAMAGPLWNSFAALAGAGPLLVLLDDGGPRRRVGTSASTSPGSEQRRRRGPVDRGDRRRSRRARRTSRRSTEPASKAGCAARARFPTRRIARRRCRRSSAFSRASRRPRSCGSPTASSSAARAPFRPSSRRSPARSRW